MLFPAVGLAPAQAEPQRSRPVERQAPAALPVYPPFYCDFIRSLAVDYANDGEAVPHAFSVTSGTLVVGETSRLAGFAVYGLSGGGAFANVTSEFRRPGRRVGWVTARPAPGSRKVPARVFYAESRFEPRMYFKPLRRYRDDRTVILTFHYKCYQGVYEREFELLVKGTGG